MGTILQATTLNRVLLSWPPAENLVDIPLLYMVKALHARLATMVMFLYSKNFNTAQELKMQKCSRTSNVGGERKCETTRRVYSLCKATQ